MKITHKYTRFLAAATLSTGLLFGCEIDEVTDFDNPSVESVTNDASPAELQVLVTGLGARHREYYENVNQLFGTFGREVYPYFGSDPRFTNEWLGLNITTTYPDFFASGASYTSPYQAVLQANVLIEAATNSTSIDEQQRAGYTGVAKTIKAFQLLWPLLQQYENGIRVDVEDNLNPGPIVDYGVALDEIRQILEDGADDLEAAGESFNFALTSGFGSFSTPEGMLQVNRAIAARAALYDEDFDAALQALGESFMNLASTDSAALYNGVYHTWGNPPDDPNPLYYPYDRETSTILIVHPAMIDDAEPGDRRINKFAERVQNPVVNSNIKDAVSGDPIPGLYQDNRYESPEEPTPWFRNEELLLIYAEANVRSSSPDFIEAIGAINTIRNIWGLPDYSGAATADALIDEILFNRRYSLWQEGGHRWIDLRRLGRLNATYVDLREGGNLFQQVARRTSETNWDAENN
ncbi:RagB/SusD family nutrient uptake outer membrane protein [Roseivirga sp. BDSF3-8]|uniref:RagB/SusD family nutrient uptake outer membrane protein n=1 Tax=Roseivirga sp. BDSF3-8 TaxID=3241598 RepID=UPI003532352B